MTPPLACFPLFTFFLSLSIMAVAAVTFGAKKAHPHAQSSLADAPREELPAWWVILLIPTVIAALIGWLAWYTSDY